jgi:hypothetical protein
MVVGSRGRAAKGPRAVSRLFPRCYTGRVVLAWDVAPPACADDQYTPIRTDVMDDILDVILEIVEIVKSAIECGNRGFCA